MKIKSIVSLFVLAVIILLSVSCAENKNEITYDYDFSKQNDQMVYTFYQAVSANANDYVGKTIRTRGTFQRSEYSELINGYYYWIAIYDPTGCCQAGFEFVWTGHDDISNFPSVGTNIEIAGIFESYLEGSTTYYHLVADTVVF